MEAHEFERAQELVDSVPEPVKWDLQRRLDAANRAAQGELLLSCLLVPDIQDFLFCSNIEEERWYLFVMVCVSV